MLMYFIATLHYPGGSQIDKTAKGFSWTQNYGCNLLNENAINGQYNTARPFALGAMVILSITLALFWYIFPQQADLKRNSRMTIQVSGLLSMLIASLLFTDYHDMVINIASFFGLIATIGTFVALYKLNWTGLFWVGMFNLVLFAMNNILYYGEGLRFYLPVVQKITFLYFLFWISAIQIELSKKIKRGRLPEATGSYHPTQEEHQPIT
jgi:hypothetical protein